MGVRTVPPYRGTCSSGRRVKSRRSAIACFPIYKKSVFWQFLHEDFVQGYRSEEYHADVHQEACQVCE